MTDETKANFVIRLYNLKSQVQGITIDGPSGIHFKRILIELINLLLEN